jgi:hypothetical protein
MRIDSCRDDLPPQSAPPVRCQGEDLTPEEVSDLERIRSLGLAKPTVSLKRVPLRCEIDERVDTTEPAPPPKPKETKCIVTSFCPRCGEKLECEECRGPMPKQCEYCLTNTPKPHRDFGEAVR